MSKVAADQAEDDFYKNIGLCITEWARVENQLFSLCAFVLKTTTQRVAIVFHRTPSIEGRLQLTDELIQTVFAERCEKGSLTKDWGKLVADIRDHFQLRNHLAHWPVVNHVHINIGRNGEKTTQTNSIEVRMGLTEIHRGKKAKQTIKPSDLPGYHAEVKSLTAALIHFHHKLAGTLPPGRFALPPER